VARVAVHEAVNVGQQNQEVRLDVDSHEGRQCVVVAHTDFADCDPSAECLAKAADALDARSAFGRQIRGDLAVAQLELHNAQGDGRNSSREFRDRLEHAIDTLRGLSQSATTEIERGRWSQNLAIALRQRSELWPAQDQRRQADLREALAATEQGLQAHRKPARDK